MKNEQRQDRLQQLLEQRRKSVEAAHKKQQLDDIYTLFSHAETIHIKDERQSETIEQELTHRFPFTAYDRVNWEAVPYKLDVRKEHWQQIPELLAAHHVSNTARVYLINGTYQYPVIETSLQHILQRHDDIFDYGLEQWVFCATAPYVIEFYEDVARSALVASQSRP